MRPIKVITDTCSDLSLDLMESYGIDYARMCLIIDGKEQPAVLGWNQKEAHDFYEIMRKGIRVRTGQVTNEEFERIFTLYLNQGFDILYIACSIKQSASINVGTLIAQKLLENPSYKDAKIMCLDSMNSSCSEGMLAIEAVKFARQGLTLEEVYEAVKGMRKKVNEFCTVHSLDTFRRSGRVSATTAFFGNLMGVKPIVISDAIGNQAAFKKVKGRKNSLDEIVRLLKDCLIDSQDQTIYVTHADCDMKEVDYVVNQIKETIPCKDIHIGYIGPTIGGSIGPDSISVYGFGKEVTFKAE